jgi:hypothetical protein
MLKPAAETPTRHAHLPLTALPYVFTEEETNLGREGDHLWSIDPLSDSSAKPSKRRRREIRREQELQFSSQETIKT